MKNMEKEAERLPHIPLRSIKSKRKIKEKNNKKLLKTKKGNI